MASIKRKVTTKFCLSDERFSERGKTKKQHCKADTQTYFLRMEFKTKKSHRIVSKRMEKNF